MARYFMGITGASGHPYSLRLLEALIATGNQVDLSITAAGCKVLLHEVGLVPTEEALLGALRERLGALDENVLRLFPEEAVEAPACSGTAGLEAVVICPCSMGTLARVAGGLSSNLVERAADVALKEGRPLILVPRETPLSQIHLENMLKLARVGAICLPAAPGFYHHPRSIEDLVDHVVGKVLDRLGIRAVWSGAKRWSGRLTPPAEGAG
ncbi:MAG: aromatic acid decarboxylase [Planctomycetes bacterium]|nr:aromatic acid decarboxylase [Planctomycetota bacterium]